MLCGLGLQECLVPLYLWYFMDFLMQEDLVTHLSENSFVEEGLGMWWFA